MRQKSRANAHNAIPAPHIDAAPVDNDIEAMIAIRALTLRMRRALRQGMVR
jgi:hypothetical protein